MSPPQRNIPREKQKKKSGLLATFFKIVFSIILVFCIGAGGAAFAYYKITGGFSSEKTDKPVSSNAKNTSFVENVQVFPGVETVQNMELIPLPQGLCSLQQRDERDIPVQNL